MAAQEQKSAPVKAKLAELLICLFGALPPRLSFYIAKVIAALLWPLQPGPARVIKTNLRHCFPEQLPSEQQTLAKQSFEHALISFFEIAYFWVGDLNKYQKITIDVPNKALLDRAVAEDRGVLLACPHLGHWELVNFFLASNYQLMALYRPPKMRELDTFMTQSRERFGGDLIPANATGVKRLYKELNHEKILAILPDQEPGPSGGVFAPFFNIPAWSMTLVSRLLKKTNAVLLYSFAERIGPAHYRLHVLEAEEAVYDKNIDTAVTALNKGVEACIAHCPEQYQWTYKRFKSRPDKQPNFYR